MRDFNVLLTCCANHVKERIDSLKQNEDGVNVNVYAVNCNPHNLPPVGMVEGCAVVPPITDSKYLESLRHYCELWKIDIIIPTATVELELMAKYKPFFENQGIMVSVASPECIAVANNKIELQKHYSSLMPKQMIPTCYADAVDFLRTIRIGNKMCCKLSDHAGGNGFAIVDDEKARDITLFNKLGENRYISMDDLCEVLGQRKTTVILQEYVDGKDYSVSVLAVNGKVTHIVGYIGHQMSYGAIIDGEIAYNQQAYEIVEKLVKELDLDGNACFDFRITPEGEVVLLEVNPRVNASLPFVWKAGVNMLYLRCKNLLGDYSDIGQFQKIEFGLKMKKFYDSRYFV